MKAWHPNISLFIHYNLSMIIPPEAISVQVQQLFLCNDPTLIYEQAIDI